MTCARLLRRCGAVEEHQGLAADGLRQDREVGADARDIEAGGACGELSVHHRRVLHLPVPPAGDRVLQRAARGGASATPSTASVQEGLRPAWSGPRRPGCRGCAGRRAGRRPARPPSRRGCTSRRRRRSRAAACCRSRHRARAAAPGSSGSRRSAAPAAAPGSCPGTRRATCRPAPSCRSGGWRSRARHGRARWWCRHAGPGPATARRSCGRRPWGRRGRRGSRSARAGAPAFSVKLS